MKYQQRWKWQKGKTKKKKEVIKEVSKPKVSQTSFDFAEAERLADDTSIRESSDKLSPLNETLDDGNRPITLVVNCTSGERALIYKRAKEAGMTIDEWVLRAMKRHRRPAL